MSITMNNKRHLLLLLAVVGMSLWFVGCDDAGNQPVDLPVRLRFLHVAYDVPAIDVRLDGTVKGSARTYTTGTAYMTITAGSHRLSIGAAGSGTDLVSATSTFEAGRDYTVFAFPPAGAFTAQLQRDDRGTTPDGQARIRFVNATSDGGSLQLRRTDGTTIGSALAKATAGEQTLTTAGSTAFAIWNTATNSAVATYTPVNVGAGSTYTVVAHGTLNPDDPYQFGVRVYTDDGEGTTAIDLGAVPMVGRVRVVQALPSPVPVSVGINGSTTVPALAFGETSAYVEVAVGSAQMDVRAAGTSLATTSATIVAGSAYSVFVSGTVTPADVVPLVLEDATEPNSGSALVRFVNLASDAGDVDILTPLGASDYALPGMQDIPYRQTSRSTSTASTFVRIPPSPPSTPYLFKIREGAEILVEKPDLTLEAGAIYTIVLIGRKSDASLRVSLIKHT